MFGFGAAASTPPAAGGGLFGAATPAAPATGGLFGAATPAASTPATGGLFGASPAPAAGGGLFGAATPAPQGQQGMMSTKDGKPITHATKWEDISPHGQQGLQQLESKIFQFREECRQLDACERLKDSAALQQSMEAEATDLSHNLKGLSNVVSNDKQSLHSFKQGVMTMMRSTEVAVTTYQRAAAKKESLRAAEAGQPVPAGVLEHLGGATPIPSPFLQESIKDLEETLLTYQQHIEELERLFQIGKDGQGDADMLGGGGMGGSGAAGAPLAETLPAILRDSHDYLVHVAAQVEAVHERTESLKDAFLRERRQRGDATDPFAEAERRQKQLAEAAAKSSAPSVPPPATPAAAAAAPAGTPAVGGLLGGAASTPAPAAGGLFGAAPAAGGFGAASTPAPAAGGLFGAAASSAPAAGGLFGAASTPAPAAGGMFGAAASPAPAAGGLFGAASPAPAAGGLFGAASPTPAAGGLFGAASPATSGAFGAAAPAAGGLFGAPAAGGFGAGAPASTGANKSRSKKKGR